MKIYHFNDMKLEPGDQFPIGQYKMFVDNASPIIQQMEAMLEERRLLLTPHKVSRLECIFALSIQYAEGFKSSRRFIYELELPDGVFYTKHNYSIGTYFYDICRYDNWELLGLETSLMEAYWTCPKQYADHLGKEIEYGEEWLISQPLNIIRRIDNN